MKVSDILRLKGNTLYTASVNDPLSDAIQTMAEKDIGSLVVMEHGDVVGMLTFREVIVAIVNSAKGVSQTLVLGGAGVFDAAVISGLIGVSRDLGRPNSRHSAYAQLDRVVAYMQEHFGENLRAWQLAELADISLAQLERHFRHVFQVTPQQYLIKLRIEMAMRLLRGEGSIAGIGQCCGFSDQSAFARQFKATVGMTPSEYRSLEDVFGGIDTAL